MGLKLGEIAPSFTLKDQEGNEFDLSTVTGKKAFILYFYPKDFTPGCTAQACSFRDHFEDFTDAGITVIGISTDTVESHSKFAAKHKLPFTLLADPDKEVTKMYGVKGHLFGLIPGRETFVFDKGGKLQMRFNSANAGQHIKEALKTIK